MTNLPSHSLETLNTLITYHDRNAEHGRTVGEALDILRAILGGNILPEVECETPACPECGPGAPLCCFSMSQIATPTPTSHQFKVGDRVVLRRDVERFPHAVVDKGATGTVAVVEGGEHGHLCVALDDTVDGLREWDNQLIWDGWSEGLQDIPFDLALLRPCEKCGEEVGEDEYCGNDKPNGDTEYLCPDCYTS